MKRFISIIICASMILCMTNITCAETTIDFNETISGVISESNDKNEYEIELSEAGTVDITFIGENIECVYLKFFDENGQEVWDERPWWNSTSKQLSFKQGVELTAGVYTFSVSEYSGYGTYEFEMSFNSANESFGEEQNGSNNTFKTADDIVVNETYNGQIAVNDTADNYSFTLDNAGNFDLLFTAENIECVYLKIYDENGQEIWDERPWWNSTSEQISFKQKVSLTAGTYYFSVSEYSGYGNYEFEMSFENANESFPEEQNGSNNTFKTANEIEVDETYIGQITVNDTIDNYVFTLENSGGFDLSFTAENIECVYLKIYDENGQEIWDERPWWNSTSEQISFSDYLALTAGTYYFSVSEYSGNGIYEFIMSFDNANESFSENDTSNDNSLKTANEIEFNTEYTGQIAINDKTDNYVFEMDNSGEFELQFVAEHIEGVELKFYDEDGQVIRESNPWWNSTSEELSFTDTVVLDRGAYYFSVSEYSGYGSYSFVFETNEKPTQDEPNTNDEDSETTSFDSKVSEWAKEEVEEAYDNDLIPETIIGEDLTEYIDRAEFAAIAVQLYEELSGNMAQANGTPFNDIYWNENEESIEKAYELGITSGTSNTTFEPDVDITREQLATMLCRAIKKYSFDGWTLENDDEYYLDTSGVNRFEDDDEISDYAKPSVYYMAKFGIIKGIDDTHFAPRNVTSRQEATGYATATREQAILMSLRIFNVSEIW